MKVPRDLSGEKVARLLTRHYGYRVTRSKGSHMTLTRTDADAKRHSVTVPRHRDLHIGTLDGIVSDVADFLDRPKREVLETLVG